MTIDIRRNGDNRQAITADELPPEIKGRIKGLVYDLSNDDLPMALLDLAHLYRALRVGSPRRSKFDEPVELTEDLRTLIFSDDRAAIEEICMGPDAEACPLVSLGLAHRYLRAAIASKE